MTGQTIAHYEITEKLGEGGMGVVYKARDTHLDRFVAIKVLPAEAVANPERKKRFVQEAKSASALNHPNIVTIHDIASGNGVDFMVMEYLPGKTLDKLIPGNGMRLDQVLKYSAQVADALAMAHDAGIVHRDLKPGNIMVSEDGLVKVLDFGLAKLTEREPPGAEGVTRTMLAPKSGPHTVEGTILGTVAYMSPEQAEGRRVDARSDIFSFGSVLYEMVTGHSPFQGESQISVLAAILKEDPKAVRAKADGVPGELERIINCCLRKDLSRRFQHIGDVKIALEDLREEPAAADAPVRPPPPARRRMLPWVVAALAIVVAILAVVRGAEETEPFTLARMAAPLTAYSGAESNPDLSPDGEQVAFRWTGERGDNRDIYVRMIEGGRPLRLTEDPAGENWPTWSPDGKSIAFTRSDSIFVIPALGGSERRIASFEYGLYQGLSWSRDGRWIAASTRKGLRLVEVGSGRIRPATETEFPDDLPAYSPDGRFLAFVRGSSEFLRAVYVLPLAGSGEPAGDPHPVTETAGRISGLDWFPDGRRLVFSGRSGSRSLLWMVPAAGDTAPEVLPIENENASSLSVAPAVSRLAYTRGSGGHSIFWRIRAFGSNGRAKRSTQSDLVPLIASTRHADAPEYSPDGSKIVFRSSQTGRDQIWRADADGTGQIQLTRLDASLAGSPSWSPDGQWIVFDAYFKDNSDIYRVRSEGGDVQQITDHGSNETRPCYSADGRWIYFSSDRTGESQIWKMPATGGDAVQVTSNGGNNAIVSPDSEFLYYFRDSSIWRLPVQGGEETRLVSGPRMDENRFALGRQNLYFAIGASREEPARIAALSLETGRTFDLLTLPSAWVQFTVGGAIAVSPDERFVLFVPTGRPESDLMLVENFR